MKLFVSVKGYSKKTVATLISIKSPILKTPNKQNQCNERMPVGLGFGLTNGASKVMWLPALSAETRLKRAGWLIGWPSGELTPPVSTANGFYMHENASSLVDPQISPNGGSFVPHCIDHISVN